MRLFQSLSENDKRALVVLSVFSFALFLYWSLQTSFAYRTEAVNAFRESRLLLMDLYNHGRTVKNLELSMKLNAKSGADQPLLTLASTSAKDKNIPFKRFQPEGDGLLQLWLEEVNFNMLIWWLSEIETKNGIRVERISVERTKRDGFVNARITLAR